jgi:hypothetical protein
MGESLNPLRENLHAQEISVLILGFTLYSYHGRELLVCWAFFTLPAACVALVILGGVLAVHAGESLIVWARTAAGMTPTLALNFP